MNATVEVRCGAAVFGHRSRRPASGHCRMMIIRAAATATVSSSGGACSASNYYKVLSLERERPEEVGAEDIRRAYRRLALRYHPDACADPSRRAESTRLFLELRRAYETLSDPALRLRYDAELFRRRAGDDAAAAAADAMARDVWEAQLRTLRARSDERRRGAGRSRRGRWFEM